jgi:hypothetical protein
MIQTKEREMNEHPPSHVSGTPMSAAMLRMNARSTLGTLIHTRHRADAASTT